MGTIKNIENLNKQLEQNQKVLDSIIYYQDEPSMSIRDIKSKTGGIRYIQFDLAAWSVLKGSELLVDVDYELVSLLYLLNESIDNSETLSTPNHLSSRETKEEYISELSDYIVEIKHRLVLSFQIQEMLQMRD